MNLEEIARLAGVSRSTVSRVVNGEKWVSAAARARVEAVIRAHDFHPNAAARSLVTRRARIIGLLIPHQVGAIFHDPFYPILIQGALEACNAVDHNLTILMETEEEDTAASDRVYRRMIRGRHVDGLVIGSNVVDDPFVDHLLRDGFPFVLVGRHPRPEVSFVEIDNRGAAREAVAHLVAHGRRRIALIAGPANRITSLDRAAGYGDALEAAGLPAEPTLVAHADFTRAGGYEAMREILANAGEAPPDAVFAASDALAYGALQALREAELRVPDDVALMGFDGLEELLVARQILSTVVQPTLDEGREAVRILLELIEHPTRAPIRRYLPTRLSLLRSCGCTPEADAGAVELTTGGVAE